MANDVNLSIGIDTKNANKSIDSLKNGLSSLQKVAAAAIAVFAGKQVFDFFNKGIEAAVAQEQAMAALGQQLRATGEFSTKALEQFAAFGDEMEKTSQFGDDVVISQVAVAKAMGLTNKQSQDLVKAAIELSSATGDTLASSVEQLGKTYDGVSGKSPVLRNALKGISKEALEAGAGIKAVQEAFGGSAAAQIETYAGSLKQAQNAFGNFQEAFGKIVIENPQLLAAIQVAKDIFVDLEQIVVDNADTISAFVSTSISLLFDGISGLVPVIDFLVKAMEGLATVLTLAFTGAVEGVKFLAEVWSASYGVMVTSVLELTDAVGLTQGASSKFQTFLNDSIKGLDDFANKSAEFAANNVQSFESFNRGFEKFGQYVDDAAKKVSNADKKVAEFAKEASKEQEKSALEVKKSSEKKAKALEALAALEKKLNTDTADSFGKLRIARDDQLKQIKQIEKDSGGATRATIELKNKINAEYTRAYSEELVNLRSAEDKYYRESIAKNREALENRKKDVENILKESSFISTIKLALDPSAASDLKQAAQKSIGSVIADLGGQVVSAVTQGEKGFSVLVQNLVKSIPIFGNLIAAAVELGTLAPEENKAAIEGFAKGITKSMENFNTNLGALPDIIQPLIGPLIEKILGPLFTSFIANLIKSLRDWPNLVGVIVKGVAGGIRASAFDLAEAIVKAFADTRAEFGRFSESVRGFFGVFAEQFKGALAFVFANNPILNELKSGKVLIQGIKLVVDFIAQLFQSIPGALFSIRDLFNNIGSSFVGAFENLGSKFTDGFLQVRDSIGNLFSGVIDAIKALPDQVKNAFGNFYEGVKNAISDAFSSFFSAFNSLAEKLKGIAGGGSITGGGGGGFKLPKFATGITEVPSGFENDGFLARLSSGERVVDKNSNQDLKDFLANSRAGGLGNEQMIALLSEISSKLNNSGSQTIEVTVDKKVLGRTILDLNRRNERINA